MKNCWVGRKVDGTYEIFFIQIDWYESIRTNNSPKGEREVPKEYKTEIKALEQCCQHRTHCLIYDIVGVIQVEPPEELW